MTEPLVHTLVVFGMDLTKETSEVLDYYRNYESEISIHDCSLHPELPLAVFYTRSLRRTFTVSQDSNI